MIYILSFFLMKALRPSALGVGTNLWETANLLVLILGCLHYLPIRSFRLYYVPLRRNVGLVWFFGFILLFMVSLWRSNDFISSGVGIAKDTVTIFTILLFLYLYQQHCFRHHKSLSRPVVVGLVHALGIFCVINLIVIAINPTYGDGNFTTFSLLGLQGKKLLFSLYPDTHPSSIGLIGAYLFVMSLERSLFGNARWATITRWVYLGASMIVVLISDSRGMLFSTLFSAAAVIALQNIHQLKWAKYAVWIIPFSHVLFLASLQVAAGFSAVQSLSRGSSDLQTGNSRKFIYEAATNELSDPEWIHLFGFGEYGTYAAGLTRYYMDHFGFEDEEVILNASVAHNTALQVIFDIGYVGLIIYLLLIFAVMGRATRLYQTGRQEYRAVLCFLAFNIAAGVTETRFGNYHEVSNQLFITLCFVTLSTYSLSTYPRKRKQPAQPHLKSQAYAMG